MSISDNGSLYSYIYDASGERVLKNHGQGQNIAVDGAEAGGNGTIGNYTIYVNPYVVVRSGQFTKHFYIESQRIASKLGESSDGLEGNGNGNGNGNGGGNGNGNNQEAFQYYYHPDHLGSSSYITDVNGEVSQHIEYFPFGETFLEEHSNTDRTPYLFNGKELDEETGLYYYGARYYDARTSVWQSVDPIMNTYLNFQHNGGVLNNRNLASYSYTYQNPVMLIDPDGRQTVARIHYMDGDNHMSTLDIEYYKMSEAQIQRVGGTYRGVYLAASHGPEGEGIKHTYIDNNTGKQIGKSRWEMKGGATHHGLYSGAGSITDWKNDYDFTFQPIDLSDAIAKMHDINYDKVGDGRGYVEDTNTLEADYLMVGQVLKTLGSKAPLARELGVEQPFRGGWSGEMSASLHGQLGIIGLLANYKQWKTDNNIKGTIKQNGNSLRYGLHAGIGAASLIYKMENDRQKNAKKEE